MSQPVDPQPPTDAGTDTLSRFHYQAQLTIPYLLACALGVSGIENVFPEHYEDIAIQSGSRWRFIQIKSRDQSQRSWRLGHLLADGGALRSLHRTFTATRGSDVRLELLLEGPITSDDPIACLAEGGDRSDPELTARVAASLSISSEEAQEFQSIVSIGPPAWPRASAKAQNLLLIMQHGPLLTLTEAEQLHERLFRTVLSAMSAERSGPEWPRYLVDAASRPTEAEARLRVKLLSSADLSNMLRALTLAPRPLLQRVVDDEPEQISVLEQKLLMGGASEDLVLRARSLRAQAARELAVRQAAALYPIDDKIEDLEVRLETYATSSVGALQPPAATAARIWDALLSSVSTHCHAIDRVPLLHADPLLLLGHACELSNRCRFGWGSAT